MKHLIGSLCTADAKRCGKKKNRSIKLDVKIFSVIHETLVF